MNTSTLRANLPIIRSALLLGLLLLGSVLLCSGAFAAPKGNGGTSPEPTGGSIPLSAETTPGDGSYLFKITAPGLYHLLGNVETTTGQHGILVLASDVTIDLNGFVLRSSSPTRIGIVGSGSSPRLTVRNGTIAGWSDGIVNTGAGGNYSQLRIVKNQAIGLHLGQTATVTDCYLTENHIGVLVSDSSILTRVVAQQNKDGILSSGRSTRLVDCSAIGNAYTGILAGVSNALVGCSSYLNGGVGFAVQANSTLERCTAEDNGGNGFSIGPNSVATGCTAYNNDAHGFKLGRGVVLTHGSASENLLDGVEGTSSNRVEGFTASRNGQNGFSLKVRSQLRNSVAEENKLHGIAAEGHCQVIGNHSVGNGTNASSGAGIYATASGNHIESNTCNQNKIGFSIVAGDNLIIRNTARGNGLNFNFAAGVEYGQIVNNPGAGFVNTNPWANIGY